MNHRLLDVKHLIERFSLKDPALPQLVGLHPVKEWKAYTLNKHPGLYIILNPFESGFECYWVSQCLDKYSQKPNITNLDAHIERTEDLSIWNDFVKLNRTEITKDDLLWKLRWTTLGYHYNWDTKEYSDHFTPFPADLSFLAAYIAAVLGYPQFSAEAGIVNYYHMDSTLAGHTDHSEFDHDAPLISISFGQEAIFLIGGVTKETEPSAIFLRHGDICVMAGASRLAYHAVPKIIHSDTRPLPTEFPSWLSDHMSCVTPANHTCSFSEEGCLATALTDQTCSCGSKGCLNMCTDMSLKEINKDIIKTLLELDRNAFDIYLKSSRINVNIRQVFKPGQTFPNKR
ncbi:nucleic acid dioxygenase ALKBH1-like isoform X2 [Gigantopelta aegis]|uniref:nucleic acid dioxygenase ALKBH1-like isoform X2 n=1 Tax=Gigantopelta aegis TaxID=1735272 RepID=UPI001B888E94|nr:nucleic acid dioxygenase ALKBH1-like isoform X2 [Gigantopelta aegis]